MPRVWIINRVEGQHYEPAEAFGDLHAVSTGYISPIRVEAMLAMLSDAWEDARSDDYLLPVGYVPLNLLAGAFWLVKFGTLNVLVWDGKGNYNVYRLSE